ncbi:asparagine synthase-domain-containing protein [Mycotypha africana]|uniref:asparagine synthase-domain-containing protein n=1 Tax=Mycotypha africana TaxID=64632 RepID=UPI0022FFC907|nr:asparagine synthase-domain-containing protein [Mycotypha africana]KAI8969063.1 asparagine synthase-domain-containing protein [Mycotypha africana]
MCGILFSVTTPDKPINQDVWNTLQELNTRRGPDAQNLECVQLETEGSRTLLLRFFSTVLHLRGTEISPQPKYNKDSGNILCWNGEIFGGIEVGQEENDTNVLMNHLENAKNEKDILNILQSIEGPFAFVYYRAAMKKIYFGRDCLGRRSLLWHRSADGHFILSSVCMVPKKDSPEENNAWEEVPANGFYRIDLSNVDPPLELPTVCRLSLSLIPWKYAAEDLDAKDTESTILPSMSIEMEQKVNEFVSVLGDAVKRRVADIPYLNTKGQPRVAILFSGGLDCICLAALADQYLPSLEAIDLLNVAFENPRAEQAKSSAQKQSKSKKKKNNKNDHTADSLHMDEPINNIYDTPDRLTGRASVEELRRIAPHRLWNFVEINVPYSEALEYRQRIIDRMYPLDTVMDLSIAMAFWFASRGRGNLSNMHINYKNLVKQIVPTLIYAVKEYESHSRVLISGLGADEQLGGYSRHREAFRHGGWNRLIEEVQLDIDRISTRNLGRDDRIMSDHGKEVRFPFLSTSVVDWLCRQPIYIKMDLRYNRGLGEKLLLRHVARQLGLINASRNWKRAIQFGAKTAKMTGEARSEKGQHKLSVASTTS